MKLFARKDTNETHKILVLGKLVKQTITLENVDGIPRLEASAQESINETYPILRYLVGKASNSEIVGKSAEDKAEVEKWVKFTEDKIDNGVNVADLQIIEDHLKTRTFFVGQRLTLADVVLTCALRNNDFQPGTLPHSYRWLNTCFHDPAFRGVKPSAIKSSGSSAPPPKAKAVWVEPKGTPEDMAKLEEQKIIVRDLKAAKASKEEITAAVNELMRLKNLCGDPAPPPAAKAKAKAENKPVQPPPEKKDGPMTDKEKAKEEKKLAKAAAKAEKEDAKRKQEEDRKAAELAKMGPSLTMLTMDSHPCGNLFIQSEVKTDRKWTAVKDLNKDLKGQNVWMRCRVQTARKQSKFCFLELRDGMHTVQGVAKGDLLNFASTLSVESVMDVYAKIETPPEPIKSCTQTCVELQIERLYCISRAQPLPFQIDDASRPEADFENIEGLVHVNQETRLNNRIIDLRTAANQAILRISSAVCNLFREFLIQEGFVEIHSPKLIGTASEGGANVFKLGYFGRDAFLAQSPQLYKQMALMTDLPKVFEIAPVFRAEESFTHRHLTEFVGLDMEMIFKEHYHEVLDVLDGLFDYIFTNLNARYRDEIETVRKQYPFEDLKWKNKKDGGCLRLRFDEAIEILKKEGPAILQEKIDELEKGNHKLDEADLKFNLNKYKEHIESINGKKNIDDLSTEDEKILGQVIHRTKGEDFYIIDKFPSWVRPFYTMEDPKDPTWSNSYDIFIRGEEIMSGAQRIHDSDMLLKRAKSLDVDMGPIKDYVDSFKYGAFPHAGGGVGMERVVMLFLNLNNIRKVSMFPRDPKRIEP